MKITTAKRTLLTLALLGTATFGFSHAAFAKTAAEERQDVEAAQRRVDEKQREVDHPKSPIEGYGAKKELEKAKKELEREKAELRAAEEREAAEEEAAENGGNRRTIKGKVLRLRGSKRFDLKVGSKTYNVILLARKPSELSKGDMVRVTGILRNGNDITKAKVKILRNVGSN